MNRPLHDRYNTYLSEHVLYPFYARRTQQLQGLSVDNLLKRKNPYLLRAKNLQIAGDLVKTAVDAFLSSQEETIFGHLMEGFAIFVAQDRYNGKKSKFRSIDLEFERSGTYFIISIKSGIYWGNSDQINTLRRNFVAARSTLIEQGVKLPIVAVNGCIYGRDANSAKSKSSEAVDDAYYRYADQDFWAFLSDDDDFYKKIIEPIGAAAYLRDQAFQAIYATRVNEMTIEFSQKFVVDGQIDWQKILEHVSKRR
jgi:hypothetical protein